MERGGIEIVRGSVTQRADWVRALDGVSQIVHLAAETGTGQSMYEVARYNEVNSQGTALLFDVLANQRGLAVRQVVLSSSRSVYGEGAYTCPCCANGSRMFPGARGSQQLAAHQWEPLCQSCSGSLVAAPTREDDPVRPASIYAATKFAQEDLVRVGAESLGIGYAILRFQNVYGEGQSLQNPYTGILSIFSTRVRRGLDLPIFEDGLETRDFVHVEDVVRAIVACIKAPQAPNAVLNVGSGVATSVLEIAGELTRALGAEPRLRVTAEYRVGDIRHNVADVRRLADMLRCESQITLETGLKRFASWVLTQPLPEDQLGRANDELRARKLMG
jgi:dTDP-L-rhamnose 4-epimerase